MQVLLKAKPINPAGTGLLTSPSLLRRGIHFVPSRLTCTSDSESGEKRAVWGKQAVHGFMGLLAILEKMWLYR